MNVFELTRTLIDIESITDNEANVGNYLFDYLSPLAALHQGTVERYSCFFLEDLSGLGQAAGHVAGFLTDADQAGQ